MPDDEFRISEEERERLVAEEVEEFPIEFPKYLESKEHNFIVLETNISTKWLVQKDRRKNSKHGENRQYVC
jgi:hypothetical protein